MRVPTVLLFALVAFVTATPRFRRSLDGYGGQEQAPAPAETAAVGGKATEKHAAAPKAPAEEAAPVVERQCPVYCVVFEILQQVFYRISIRTSTVTTIVAAQTSVAVVLKRAILAGARVQTLTASARSS